LRNGRRAGPDGGVLCYDWGRKDKGGDPCRDMQKEARAEWPGSPPSDPALRLSKQQSIEAAQEHSLSPPPMAGHHSHPGAWPLVTLPRSATATRRGTFDRIGEGHGPKLWEQRMLFGGTKDPRIRNGSYKYADAIVFGHVTNLISLCAPFLRSATAVVPHQQASARAFLVTSRGPPTAEVTPGRHGRCPAR